MSIYLHFRCTAHGAGYVGLLAAFADSLREGKKQQADTMAQDALESHLLAFAAEQARLEKQVISTKKL